MSVVGNIGGGINSLFFSLGGAVGSFYIAQRLGLNSMLKSGAAVAGYMLVGPYVQALTHMGGDQGAVTLIMMLTDYRLDASVVLASAAGYAAARL